MGKGREWKYIEEIVNTEKIIRGIERQGDDCIGDRKERVTVKFATEGMVGRLGRKDGELQVEMQVYRGRENREQEKQ